MTADGRVVAERTVESDLYYEEASLVPEGEIPDEVRAAVTPDAFAESQREVAAVEALFNLGQ